MTQRDESYTEQLIAAVADAEAYEPEHRAIIEREQAAWDEYRRRWAAVGEAFMRALGAGEDLRVLALAVGRPIDDANAIGSEQQLIGFMEGHLRAWVERERRRAGS